MSIVTGYKDASGRDLGLLFLPGTNTQTTGYKMIEGGSYVDIGTKFATGTTGITTGYKNPSGTDLGTLFAANWTTISDGSSLTGWTNTGVVIASGIGNPAPSFNANVTTDVMRYCYIDLASNNFIPSVSTNLRGYQISFDVRSSRLMDFYFGCNSAGLGKMLRVGALAGFTSGFANTTTWTSWGSPAAGGPTLTTNAWNTLVITINSSGTASYTYNGISAVQTITVTDGTFIGFQGDGNSANQSNSYLDNIIIRPI